MCHLVLSSNCKKKVKQQRSEVKFQSKIVGDYSIDVEEKGLLTRRLKLTHIVEVDDHGAIAHVCGLVVGLAADREGHSPGA